jgi:phosphatidylethanolamine/phosphatidyl-N-methylethanolamine N-methyltransferase
MPKAISNSVYDIYGRFYDGFEMLFKKRLGAAITAVPFHTGDRVLDVGIGTGLSLEFYPPCVHVTGIDLSAGMLAQAQRKVDEKQVRAQCAHGDTELLQADALNLPFADKSFDTVVLSHVVTTVPDPLQCLREAIRVARDRAHIVLVNHFRSPWPVISWVETAIDPICRKLGWRCDLSLEYLLRSLNVEGAEHKIASKGFIFRIVYLEKHRETVRVVEMPERVEGVPELGTQM